MADHFPFKLKERATIAVMGLPYTFRMELGRNIANWAECSNLKFEVILDALPNQLAGAGARDDAAFGILCKTAVSLLKERDKLSCVVINFPIPTKPQLQTLLRLVNSYNHRLLIIECQRRNEFRWRQAVEHPTRGISYNLRYDTGNREPGKWEDVEKAILNHQQRLDDYFATLSQRYSYSVYVKKLVVDPFEDLKARDFTASKGLDQRSLLAEAIKHYLSCDNLEYWEIPDNLDYSLWRRQWLEHRASSRGRGRGATTTESESHWCRPGDCILRFTNKLLLEEADAICGACEQNITCNNSTEGEGEGAYYYCQFCSLSLHELCALALSPTAITAKNTNPRSQIVSYYAYPRLGDAFKGSTHACHSCKKDGKQFPKRCDACVFQTHLKCQLLPTAFNHSCDQHHFLSIRLSSWDDIENAVYDCKACGLRGVYSSYCCNICNSEYHLECVLDMPLHTKTKEIAHGGHTHSIDIHFSCGQREYEYKWCCVCYDDINPDTWVYICQDCDFIAHLYCIFPSKSLRWYKGISLDES